MSPFQGLGDLVRSPTSCCAGGRLLEAEDVERNLGDISLRGWPLLRPRAAEENENDPED